ncbi:MAG: flagellar export chaperone FliS [Candidatus Puniceispirillales bacterium]|jgi:flagellar biosynthetic protein FliS|tara:strand:- start:1518 stop:1952 length:435 start_codon:yes stop_codon:yes gene_type:complete
MSNKNYIDAYKKSSNSMNSVKSSHEIIRELMFHLANSMDKIVLDINEYKNNEFDSKSISKKELALKKSKNMSKSLSIIYGLQTCLDFDKAPEIAGNLFQLYEFARQKVISSLTKKDADGINQAITVIREILDGWQNIAIEDRKL